MSVINKMLRDLDRRQADTSALGALGTDRPGGRPQLAALGGLAGSGPWQAAAAQPTPATDGRRMLIWGTLGVLLLALSAGFWWLQRPERQALTPVTLPPAVAAKPVAVAVLAPAPASVPASALPLAPVAVAAPPSAGVSGPVARVLPAASAAATQTPTPGLALAPASAPARLPASKPPLAMAAVPSPPPPFSGNLSLKLSADQLHVPAGTQARAEPPARPASEPLALAPMAGKPAAARELVAQAQALRAAGEHSAALLLLKGALTRVESAPADAVLDRADVAALAREYARQALADGQTQEVLTMLERLEPHLTATADIWAIRGNAAQRLGHHAQAVAAYQQALAQNPNEPRWLLGAAISLAALGQTGAAADMAERVRLARAMPADVANYLRQLGVHIKTD